MNELFCLIVGGGLSGLVLANLLADENILLIEQDEQLGGVTSYMNFAASNTSFQVLANIKDDKFYEDLVSYSPNYSDFSMLKVLSENSSLAIELLQSFGVEFEFGIKNSFNHQIPRELSPLKDAKQSVINPLINRLISKNVNILTKAKLVDFKDNFASILYKDEILKIKVKNIAFCTGGFSNDKDFIKIHYPLAFYAKTLSKNNANSLKIMLKNSAIPTQLSLMRFAFILPMEIFKYGILINSDFKRFVSEDKGRQELAIAILNEFKQGKKVKLLLDNHGINYINDTSNFKKYYSLKDIDERLISVVNDYNLGIINRIDEFGKNLNNIAIKEIKESLFYLCDVDVYLNYTLGGVKSNTNAQIIDINTNKAINNMFVIGEASAMFGEARLSGVASTACVVFAMNASKTMLENKI